MVVGVGAVPAFRDLHAGDQGTDVAQLQALLTKLGFPAGTVDGKFDSTVTDAVKRWQRSLGIASDGAVLKGDVIYVSQLPARLALDPRVVVGARLAGGETSVQVLPSTPQFKIDLPENQARMLSSGMIVDIQGDGGRWTAKIADVVADDKGARVAHLASASNEAICGTQCAAVKIDGETLYPSRIWLVAPTSGIVVPTVSLVTDVSGNAGVILADGTFRQVTIVANAGGTAVIKGVEAGEVVRAPGKPEARES
ncbi:peptidoglycan-binding domain-containing protein [Dactylosporangium sp. NPDC005555]|uniref:peptidoglycan-binding domain-containing protein n=1 Tax=Dactylosporangium sp. NPDC005555 TaxID=3154889 RepID=UPI0033B38C25